jgi:hypothetical protein
MAACASTAGAAERAPVRAHDEVLRLHAQLAITCLKRDDRPTDWPTHWTSRRR